MLPEASRPVHYIKQEEIYIYTHTYIFMSQANIGDRNFQPRSQIYSPLWVLATFQTLHKLGLLKTFSSFVLFLEPLARTWVSPKPRQDDPLFGLAGKRHSTGGQQTPRSPCCVRVSGGLMNPDRTATEAECLENLHLGNRTGQWDQIFPSRQGLWRKRNFSENVERCPNPRVDTLADSLTWQLLLV